MISRRTLLAVIALFLVAGNIQISRLVAEQPNAACSDLYKDAEAAHSAGLHALSLEHLAAVVRSPACAHTDSTRANHLIKIAKLHMGQALPTAGSILTAQDQLPKATRFHLTSRAITRGNFANALQFTAVASQPDLLMLRLIAARGAQNPVIYNQTITKLLSQDMNPFARAYVAAATSTSEPDQLSALQRVTLKLVSSTAPASRDIQNLGASLSPQEIELLALMLLTNGAYDVVGDLISHSRAPAMGQRLLDILSTAAWRSKNTEMAAAAKRAIAHGVIPNAQSALLLCDLLHSGGDDCAQLWHSKQQRARIGDQMAALWTAYFEARDQGDTGIAAALAQMEELNTHQPPSVAQLVITAQLHATLSEQKITNFGHSTTKLLPCITRQN